MCTFDDEFATKVRSKKHKVKRIAEICDVDIAANLSFITALPVLFFSSSSFSLFEITGNGDCDPRIERRRKGLSFFCVFCSLLMERRIVSSGKLSKNKIENKLSIDIFYGLPLYLVICLVGK